MRIAITGATGYLGAWLSRALLTRGDQVVVLSRTPGTLKRLVGLPVESFSYDPSGLEAAIKIGPVDAVVHAACAYGRAGETPAALVEANLLHPLRIALAAGTKIGTWINIGTGLPRDVSPYAISKTQFVDWLEQLPLTQLAPRTVVALEHVYGPADDSSKFLTRVARACIAGHPLELTAGTQMRDFVHIEDGVSGILTLLDSPCTSFRIIPLGSGKAVSVRSVIERIHTLAGSRSDLRFGAVSTRPNEPDLCRADITALCQLGWIPTITLDTGLKALVISERELGSKL